jgi:hypothetical protein
MGSAQMKANAQRVQQALEQGRLAEAQAIVFHWMQAIAEAQQPEPVRQQLRNTELWLALADVVERTNDHYLLEIFWQQLDKLSPAVLHRDTASIPLIIIPILNGMDHLGELLRSIDYNVETLAIIDNSTGASANNTLADDLKALQRSGHPLIGNIEIAHPFNNIGVAASWNLALRAFPSAPYALIVNHDIVWPAGALQRAVTQLDPTQPQFFPLLPLPQQFSAFLITALCWNRIGLFDPSFYPAYCEDLDYRDRLRADTAVQWLEDPELQQAMAACNPEHSATITSDPELAERNRTSFALNRLWWLSHRRLRHDPRGTWVRQWLAEWKD